MAYIAQRDVDPPDPAGTPKSVPVIPELRGVFAHFPDGLSAFDQMYQRMVGVGRLDRSVRLVVMGAAAHWREDGFITSEMFRLATEEGFDRPELDAVLAEVESSGPTTPLASLLVFCKKATTSAFTMVERDVDAVRTAGWTNGQIVEAVTMVGLSGYMTVMAASGGLSGPTEQEANAWR